MQEYNLSRKSNYKIEQNEDSIVIHFPRGKKVLITPLDSNGLIQRKLSINFYQNLRGRYVKPESVPVVFHTKNTSGSANLSSVSATLSSIAMDLGVSLEEVSKAEKLAQERLLKYYKGWKKR